MRATRNYRRKLEESGLRRVEVRARREDRDLIRELAKRLAEDAPSSETLRERLRAEIQEPEPSRGRIAAALMNSPLVGSGIEFERDKSPPRDFEF